LKRIVLLALVLVAGCSEDVEPPRPQSASGVTKASVDVPVGSDGLTIEQKNVRDRLLEDNKHQPKEDQPEKYNLIRNTGKSLAHVINDNCPEGREKSLAVTKLEEAIMWANAAIARTGGPIDS
jgi:hypothetical protein